MSVWPSRAFMRMGVGGFQPVALPEISDGPHFWYAVQWFMFTGIGALGVFVFIRGDLRERRTGERKPVGKGRGGRSAGGKPGAGPGSAPPSGRERPELTKSGA